MIKNLNKFNLGYFMKRVTSQNIGNDGVMMNFEQIKKLLSEIHLGYELFVVVFNDDDNFIQVYQPSISDVYEIQMRSHHNNGITEFREKGVIGIAEVEKYFKAYCDNESWLFEDFNKWVDIIEDPSCNIQIINDNEYFRDKLEHNQIMEILPKLKINDTVVLLDFGFCYHFKIHFYQTGSISQYSLNIRKDNKNYWKTVNFLEMVQSFVSQYLNNEDIDLKSWSGPYYG